MFKYLYRRTLPKKLSEYEKDIAMLLYEQNKINYIVAILIFIFFSFPIIMGIYVLLCGNSKTEDWIISIILFLIYLIFFKYFYKRFKKDLKDFYQTISATWYTEEYTMHGDALVSYDFNKIKTENSILYNYITSPRARGRCYSICFNILEILQEGEIKFIAVKNHNTNDDSIYTMHVLYVNNGWCYDTYSQRQYPLNEHLEFYHAIEYMTLSFDDIKDFSYEEFKNYHKNSLKRWCEENSCSQNWK